MAQSPKVTAEKFSGVWTNVDPDTIPPGGAVDQWNMRSQLLGQLEVRPGMMPVTFGSGGDGTGTVIAMYQSPITSGTCVLYQLSDGSINVGITPSVS